MGAARNGCKTLPWQVRVLVDSGWVVDRDGGWIMQMGWFIRWLIGYNNLTKDVTTHTFNPPAKQKDGVLNTHVLTGITNFGT